MTISLYVAVTTWSVFWGTYWTFGILISCLAHFKNIRPIESLHEVLSVLIVNMFWSFVAVILLYLSPLRAMTDSYLLTKFILTYILTDVWFFHVHVFLHHPQIYNKLHKFHHNFRQPYALTALYCSPYECVVGNVFSAGLGCVIFQISAPYIYIWFFLVALNALFSHSGIHFPPFMDGSHDLHHEKFMYNYSLSTYLDSLYGTLYIDNIREKLVETNIRETTLANFPIDTSILDD
tara:strand:+ start:919 stop:1623 length:705 start_codon:yes stop_codon:yes gene_type:complete